MRITSTHQGLGQPGLQREEGAEAPPLMLKVAALMADIEALKRERAAQPVLSARRALASPYFRRRRPQPGRGQAA